MMANGAQKDGAITASFRAMTSLADQAVIGHYCQPSTTRSDGTSLSDEALLLDGGTSRPVDKKLLISRMVGTLRVGINGIGKGAASDETRLVLPINGNALSFRQVATAFTTEMKTFDRPVYARLTLEVLNMTDSVSLSYIDNIAVILFSFCRDYIARVTMQMPSYVVFANTNFAGVSFDLQDKPWPIDTIRPYLEAFHAKAEKCRLKTYLHGVRTQEILGLTRDIGIDFVDGVVLGA